MKKTFYSTLILFGMAALSFQACKKESPDSDSQAMTSVEESAQAEDDFTDSFSEISNLSAESSLLLSADGNTFSTSAEAAFSNSCISVNISPSGPAWPKTVTLDFGSGCSADNVTRKGKIVAVFTDRFKNTGAKVTISYDGYYVNNRKIEGSKTITNNGKNAAGNYNFGVALSESFTGSKGIFTRTASRNIEWVEGSETYSPSDDVFSITGTASGSNSAGKSFSSTITKALIKKAACRFIVAGTIEFKAGSSATHILDFGNGDCDANATVTVNGESKPILLHK